MCRQVQLADIAKIINPDASDKFLGMYAAAAKAPKAHRCKHFIDAFDFLGAHAPVHLESDIISVRDDILRKLQ